MINFTRLPDEFSNKQNASIENIREIEQHFDCTLPSDYHNYLKAENGGEGFIGNTYLILWRAEEILQFNKEYEIELDAPGFMLFGSNGSGEGIAFDLRLRSMSIVAIPFIGMSSKESIYVASTFIKFLKYLYDSDGGIF